ncbi:alpha/beta fold hydrolase [Aquimarina sp. AU474]|uniref:alpha/beta fold hydrolase n=1 Tax=Aquimarina sp. AU474 TaxID=2108529 RepID=UPI001F2C22DA|nr:alpha/beta hydrolase [Aquimarina sp. AU474]
MDLIINSHRLRFSTNPKELSIHKPTIVFLHDSLGCIELWRDFPKKIEIATGCNVISYDRQGYGKSSEFSIQKRDNDYLKDEAKILGNIIDTLALKQIILFGHSDGGSIALLAAALFPSKILGVITEGAHVFVEKETLFGIKEAVISYQDTNLKEKLSKYHGDKTDSVFKMWTETWLSKDYLSWNIEQYLYKIQCPSLIIQGANDEYGTFDQVHSIVNNTSGTSEALIIPDIGHTPHKENAEIVIANVTQFIDDLA